MAGRSTADEISESAGADQKTGKRISTTRDFLTAASAAVTVIGAAGTLGVWLAANFYVGQVNVIADRPFNDIEVDVFDMKGKQYVFHSPTFELMPGKYHLAISADGKDKQQSDVVVKLSSKTDVKVSFGEVAQATADEPKPHKWWQFWKKSPSKDSAQDE